MFFEKMSGNLKFSNFNWVAFLLKKTGRPALFQILPSYYTVSAFSESYQTSLFWVAFLLKKTGRPALFQILPSYYTVSAFSESYQTSNGRPIEFDLLATANLN